MQRQDWLSLVAVHSDSWLMSVAFYNGARLDAEGRRQLFNDINSLPTCYEIVSGRVTSKPPGSAAQVGKRPVGSGAPAPMPVAHMKRGRPGPGYRYSRPDDADDNEEEEGAGSDPCPNCGRLYKSGEFWIACDICDRWYDGQCVGMTPQKADRSNKWACPFCAARG